MDRYLLEVKLLVQIDVPNGDMDDIVGNFYARLSELVQSEDHMLDAQVNAYQLAGNSPQQELVKR
jgi:hypothetical protein